MWPLVNLEVYSNYNLTSKQHRRFFGRDGEIGHEAGVGEHEQSRTADGGTWI